MMEVESFYFKGLIGIFSVFLLYFYFFERDNLIDLIRWTFELSIYRGLVI